MLRYGHFKRRHFDRLAADGVFDVLRIVALRRAVVTVVGRVVRVFDHRLKSYLNVRTRKPDDGSAKNRRRILRIQTSIVCFGAELSNMLLSFAKSNPYYSSRIHDCKLLL